MKIKDNEEIKLDLVELYDSKNNCVDESAKLHLSECAHTFKRNSAMWVTAHYQPLQQINEVVIKEGGIYLLLMNEFGRDMTKSTIDVDLEFFKKRMCKICYKKLKKFVAES